MSESPQSSGELARPPKWPPAQPVYGGLGSFRRVPDALTLHVGGHTRLSEATLRSAYAGPAMAHTVEFPWSDDCPNRAWAHALPEEVLAELAPGTAMTNTDATDPAVAATHRFPGSPTGSGSEMS